MHRRGYCKFSFFFLSSVKNYQLQYRILLVSHMLDAIFALFLYLYTQHSAMNSLSFARAQKGVGGNEGVRLCLLYTIDLHLYIYI